MPAGVPISDSARLLSFPTASSCSRHEPSVTLDKPRKVRSNIYWRCIVAPYAGMRVSSVVSFSRSNFRPAPVAVTFSFKDWVGCCSSTPTADEARVIFDEGVRGRADVGAGSVDSPFELSDHTGIRCTEADVRGNQQGGFS